MSESDLSFSQPPANLGIGDRVQLTIAPPYLKTAEPMPMLRPPDLVPLGSSGEIVEQRPGGAWVVRFERGSFLLDGQYLEAIAG